jgi:Na+/H+ antiporter NhaC
MFYFWHTAIVILFLAFSFFMGYKMGKKNVNKTEEPLKENVRWDLIKIWIRKNII